MKRIHIRLDKKLLHAADQAARRTKRNRSVLVRDALREHLRRLASQAKEQSDRAGYLRGHKDIMKLFCGKKSGVANPSSANY